MMIIDSIYIVSLLSYFDILKCAYQLKKINRFYK
jgi:hypothetical protein